jgi:hypothetical protein
MGVGNAADSVMAGLYSSLAEVDGGPAISYFHFDDQDLVYAESSSADGASLEDWTIRILTARGWSGVIPAWR